MADRGTERFTEVDGLRLRWVEYGDGGDDPVLLIHGWPTSSYLWRGVAPGIAERGRRVIAIDLPGFGGSDKPVDATYSFGFYGRALDGVLAAAGAERIGLAVHDLGGPAGLHWASQNPGRVERLALLNTLAYPGLSVALVTFFALLRTPGVRTWATSPAGLRFTMRTGVADKGSLTNEDIAAYQAPYRGDDDARKALRLSGLGMHPDGMKDVEAWLKTVEVPVRIIYGARDRILHDVAKTMQRVEQDVQGPVETTVLEDCGHFCQEECPEEIGAALGEFFGR